MSSVTGVGPQIRFPQHQNVVLVPPSLYRSQIVYPCESSSIPFILFKLKPSFQSLASNIFWSWRRVPQRTCHLSSVSLVILSVLCNRLNLDYFIDVSSSPSVLHLHCARVYHDRTPKTPKCWPDAPKNKKQRFQTTNRPQRRSGTTIPATSSWLENFHQPCQLVLNYHVLHDPRNNENMLPTRKCNLFIILFIGIPVFKDDNWWERR